LQPPGVQTLAERIVPYLADSCGQQ
jgi:hypothetical protein